MEKVFYVYILASKQNGTLYIGVTNDLVRRVYEHKEGLAAGFTKKYDVKMLVYFEQHAEAATAIQREKTMKEWPRQWKINQIETTNPTWRDLYADIVT
jgi:putative endonuclease